MKGLAYAVAAGMAVVQGPSASALDGLTTEDLEWSTKVSTPSCNI